MPLNPTNQSIFFQSYTKKFAQLYALQYSYRIQIILRLQDNDSHLFAQLYTLKL